MNYSFNNIEPKWQKRWLEERTFEIDRSKGNKFYCLDMFPYPSASGLHVGHIEGYTATDIVARFKRMQGFNVLHPFGFDAFGLPAEQYALHTGNNPREFTYANIKNFKKQLISAGMAISWDQEFATADMEYFKWTQWIFKKLYEHNLAFLKDTQVNFCEELGSVLANDEIINEGGIMVSERGRFPVVKKNMKQWVLNITAYASRLLNDLDLLDWPDSIKDIQRNWIGKSTGAIVKFVVDDTCEIDVFTTRPDTIYGVSYIALAPEHPAVLSITTKKHLEEVEDYIKSAMRQNDLDRMVSKIKTGVPTGAYAKHPITRENIPIWIADYILSSYGTGAIMGVPAHDERDYQFATVYDLPIIKVIDDDGVHINSDIINGLYNEEATSKIIEHLENSKLGYKHLSYKLRDWVFSRQRYWGEPFPVYYDELENIYLIEDGDLPVNLPYLRNIKPSGTGASPLTNAKEWLYFEKNGIKYHRDTNTMPQLAGSSWYYIGFILKEKLQFIPLDSIEAKKELDKWLPVDLYMGGAEHAVGHLLYARFWHKFLYDLGLVSTKEPFLKLVNQGMILGSDNSKMSKSRGNVVNPDEIIASHGADSLRLYEMFLGPIAAEKPWKTESLDGIKRFLERVWRMYDFISDSKCNELEVILHQTIKKVTEDFNNLNFNTAISQMMIFVNEVYKTKVITKEQGYIFLKLLNPIAPHLTEELNEIIYNNKEMLANSTWPNHDENILRVDNIEMMVQVNGKLRGKIKVSIDSTNEIVEEKALKEENVIRALNGLQIIKVIVVKNKIINIVAK